jgi:hypothetical protein
MVASAAECGDQVLELARPRRRLGEVGFAGALHIVTGGGGDDSVSPDMGRFEC